MKILKPILLLLGILILGFLIFAAVSPKNITVNRDITINADKSEVYNYVKSLKKTSDASVWQKKDPNVKKSYRGSADGEIGSIYRWESENEDVGVGEQEILALEPNKRVKTALRFEKPFEMNDVADFYLEDAGNGTKLTWDYKSEPIPFPFNAFVVLQGVQGQLEKDFEVTLQTFKNEIEK